MKKKTKPKASKKSAKKAAKNPTSKIRPLGDRVLLKEIKEKEGEVKTSSGIYLPESMKDDKNAKRASVVAVGEGHYDNGKLVPIRLKAGDMVLYSWGDPITIDGEDYMLVRENEISAIIKQ